MPIIDANIDILNEVYFGGDSLENALLLLSKFRSKYKGKPYNEIIDYDADLINLLKELKEIFGFYKFSLAIINDNDHNAWTIPLGDRIYIDKEKTGDFTKRVKFTKNKSGFKYANDTKYVAMIEMSYGLISDEEFTDREVMAAILHEIGHNFSRTFIEKGDVYNLIQIVVKNINGVYGTLKAIEASNELQKYEINTDEYNRAIGDILEKLYIGAKVNNNVAIKYMKIYENILSSAVANPEEIKQSLENLSNVTVGGVNGGTGLSTPSIISIINNIGKLSTSMKFKRDNEKFADTFASMYGYAKEIESLSSKIYKYDGDGINAGNDPKSIKKVLFDLVTTPFKIIHALMDPHDENLGRVKTQLKYLNWEIKNLDLDPNIEKEIRDQYNYLYNKLKGVIDLNDHRRGSSLRKTYNLFLFVHFDRDFKRLLSGDRKLFDNIDRVSRELDIEESSILIEMADPNYTDLEM